MKRFLPLIAALVISAVSYAEDVSDAPPGYKEIPYYLRKLEETDREDEKVRFGKLIHDAVVNADLSSKKVVKEMEPFIERIQKAMDSGLDRASITGQTQWLASAVTYFEQEKLQPVVSIPETDWLPDQSKAKDGRTISTYPEKVLVHYNGQSEQVAEHTSIHEAVLSPDGRFLAYYRLIDPKGKKAEIWLVNVSTKKKKQLATVDSCYTLLFSLDSGKLYFQTIPSSPGAESDVFVVSRGGGRPKQIAKATILQTVVEKGDYRGNLILYRKTLHHLGVSQLECPYAYKENGQNLGRLVNATCR